MSDIASYRVAETATQDKKLTKQDLNRIFWNIQSMSFSYNYEKLQTIGFAHCMIPVLERLYADADKATRIKAMKRHLEFYNSQVNTLPVSGIAYSNLPGCQSAAVSGRPLRFRAILLALF